MKRMIYLALAALLIAGLAVPLAWGQEDTYFIKSDDLGGHDRPLVMFGHAKHVEWVEEACISCHHDYNKNMGLSDSEGAACSECHGAEATEDNQIDLVSAYHRRCKNCHQNVFGKGKKNAPIMCGQCHNRDNKPPEE